MKNNEINSLLKEMLRIRAIEEELANRYSEKKMRCPMHLCIGQEAIAVGVCANLSMNDKIFSNHRAHGHYLAKGGDAKKMVAELYGKKSGCCGGRGGSMHLIDQSVGFMGSTPIVGGTVPIAVGVAWSNKLKKINDVTVVFFGDGCFEEGVVHESMNFATLHELPVIFICENNYFSVYTKINARQSNRPIWKIAEAHGLNAKIADGNDIKQVISVSKDLIDAARVGVPGFIEFTTYRWREHCGPNFDNELQYRTKDEVDLGHSSCPIDKLIYENQIDEDVINRLNKEISLEIDSIFDFAQQSKNPSKSTIEKYVYAS